MELKKLELPSSSLDLKDFLDYCKIYSNYEEYANFYQNQIKERENDLTKYGIKILREHFLKTESEWLKILSEKDCKKLLESKYIHIKPPHKIKYHNNPITVEDIFDDKDYVKEWQHEYLKENQIYVRCGVTNTFISLSPYFMKLYKSDIFEEILLSFENKNKFTISDFEMIIKISFNSHYFPAPFKNRDGSYQEHNIDVIINLIDYSVKLDHQNKYCIIPSKIPHNRFG